MEQDGGIQMKRRGKCGLYKKWENWPVPIPSTKALGA